MVNIKNILIDWEEMPPHSVSPPGAYREKYILGTKPLETIKNVTTFSFSYRKFQIFGGLLPLRALMHAPGTPTRTA